MVSWLHCCGLEARQTIMVEEYDRAKLLTLWQPDAEHRGRALERKGLGTR